jgi:CBS domain-containing protein
MTIGAILQGRSGETFSLTGETSVREAVALLARHRIGAMPVLRDGAVAGIFSERDVVYRLAEQGGELLDQPVSSVMITPVISVTRETGVMTALSLMTRRRIRHLPVLDGERLIGFVSIGDLVKYRIDKIEAEAAAMRDYIAG